ncbi:MAG: methyltransferase [Desulfobacterales bacterium]|nr:methyltransferase [Desulfobacterales bacterium]
MKLPLDLEQVIESELANYPLRDIAKVANQLCKRYRDGYIEPEQTFIKSSADVIAYTAYRFPATYAAISSCLSEIQARRLDWEPKTVLDVGSGPGTSAWVVKFIWPNLECITLLEHDKNMLHLAKKLFKQNDSSFIQKIVWKETNLISQWECQNHDFVIAAYILGELPTSKHQTFIEKLWSHTNDTLLIIEPGNPRGASFIRNVRDQLIQEGANIIAPCPHIQSCPAFGDDWCHFSQRIERTWFQRIVKRGFRPYADEKFSYIAASRHQGTAIKSRIVKQPKIRKGHVLIKICETNGTLKDIVVTKKEGNFYRHVHNLNRGSALT